METFISTKELFREAWRVYSEKFKALIAIALAPAVLFLISNLFEPTALIFAAAGFAFSIASTVAIIFAITRGGGVVSSYRETAPYLLPYLWLVVLTAFVILGGFVLFIVPGLIFSLWFIFGVYAVVLDSKKGLAALFLSREYTRGYFWPIVGRMAALIIAALVAVFVSAFVLGWLYEGAVAAAAASVFISSFSTVYMYLMYKNLKELKPEASESVVSAKVRNFIVLCGIFGVVVLVALIAASIANAPVVQPPV